MSRRNYPRIGSMRFRPKWVGAPKGAPKCCACGAPATHRVCIEFDYFRGDDEVVNACADHCNDAKALADAWVKADKAKQAAGVPGTPPATIQTGAPHDETATIPSSASPTSGQPGRAGVLDASDNGSRDGAGGRDARSDEQPGGSTGAGDRGSQPRAGQAAEALTHPPRNAAASGVKGQEYD